MYQYRATLLRVVDGDTIDVDLDLGFSIHHQVRLRLKGINAPERNTDAGKKAKAFVEQWFEGMNITVSTIKDEQEKYGRFLARIITAKGDLAMDLVEAGHAKVAAY